MAKERKKQSKVANKKRSTAQKTIPYARVYDDKNTFGGIIETSTGHFTKSYFLEDANYSNEGEEAQDEMLTSFEKVLVTFNHMVDYQITVNSRNIDQAEFNKKVLIGYNRDEFDELRTEHNEMLLNKLQEGKNNLRPEKYLTLGLDANDIKDALSRLNSIERDLNIKIKKLNGVGLSPLSLTQRLEIFHDIYNLGNEGSFAKTFDINALKTQGITTKDLISPSYFDFKNKSYMKIGDVYARAFFLKSIPSQLSSNLIESLYSIPTNVLISTHYEIQPQDDAVSFASMQVTNIAGDVVQAQKNLTKSGAMPDLISPRLDTARKDAAQMLDDITNHNMKLLHVTVCAVVFASTEEDLALYSEQIKTRAKEHICQLDNLMGQQERGLTTALPFALNMLSAKRVLTSEAASAIQPFSTKELVHENGLYYGQNKLSKNLLMYNRMAGMNQNCVILGMPGAGKSFTAKEEMYQVYLNKKNAQIFVIDPEREYVYLANHFKGQIIPIVPGGQYHINPLDLNITKDEEGDPLATKIDYVISLIEIMLGNKLVLSPSVQGLVDHVLRELYTPYIQNLEERNLKIDTEICPTFEDVYNKLMGCREPEGRSLAASIKLYCIGSLNLFAFHTNISTENKFIVYDIKNIGSNLQELGYQICLNDIWNRMLANKVKGIWTWFYIDEFYLMLRTKSSAQYLQMVWKRARKWMGIPTGITQNVTDLLSSEESLTILNTSPFAILLNQSYYDRVQLASIFKISEEQQEDITNVGQGEGLIYTGDSLIPVINEYPTDTKLYKILSTKSEEAEKAGKSNRAVIA